MAFTVFSTDELVELPTELFTEILPTITLPSELKVTLYIFYRLNRQRGFPRRIHWDDLAADHVLRQSLRAVSKLRSPEELLDEGLDSAIKRRTLLHVTLPGDGRLINWYLVNTKANQAWIAQGDYTNMAVSSLPNPKQQPTLVRLYEQNIGLVTPLLVEELREAEETYPYEWLEAAIREAVHANVRSWRYIKKVLERWASNGRHHASNQLEGQQTINVDKYTNGAFNGIFRLGSDKSGLS